jgi:hypothetical protein
MHWSEVRSKYPEQWLLIEALSAHTLSHRRVFNALAVIEPCSDGATALRRHRELSREYPGRELYYVHTANADFQAEERAVVPIRPRVWSRAEPAETSATTM